MDTDKIIASLPTMNEMQRTNLKRNIERTKASGRKVAIEAAERVDAALRELEMQPSEMDLSSLAPDEIAKRLADAFMLRPLKQHEAVALKALLEYPGLTSRALSQRIGWQGQSWNAHFGSMCRDREELLWRAPDARTRDGQFYSAILALYDAESATWRVRPELERSLRRLLYLPTGSDA